MIKNGWNNARGIKPSKYNTLMSVSKMADILIPFGLEENGLIM